MKTPTLGETTDTDEHKDHAGDLSDGISRRTTLSLLGVGALGMVASSPAQAAPDEQCFTVDDGKVEGQLTSPTTTAGTLTDAGPLNGTTALTIEETAASAGLSSAAVPASTISYTGVFNLTTNHGEVNLRDVGIFDTALPADGEFTSRGRVVSGTDRWEDATGVMFFWGDVDADGTFTAEANGTICIPKE